MAQLNKQELIDLTGADTPTKQKNVLKANKIPWVDKADGTITTTLEAVNHALIHDSANDNDGANWGSI